MYQLQRNQSTSTSQSNPLIVLTGQDKIECKGPHLEVVWQLRAPSIARVHGDEDGAGGVQLDLRALKQQRVWAWVDTCSNSITHWKVSSLYTLWKFQRQGENMLAQSNIPLSFPFCPRRWLKTTVHCSLVCLPLLLDLVAATADLITICQCHKKATTTKYNWLNDENLLM